MRQPKVVYHRSEQDGRWYWKVVAANGRIVMLGGEGFQTKENARRSYNRATYIARYEAIEK